MSAPEYFGVPRLMKPAGPGCVFVVDQIFLDTGVARAQREIILIVSSAEWISDSLLQLRHPAD
jgi:hypothetical protein